MRDDAAGFTGSIPEHYEHGLGPMTSWTTPPKWLGGSRPRLRAGS